MGLRINRTILAAWTYVASMLYYWYRYPFKINSTGTSPTYADTPLMLKIGKYGLLAVLSLVWLLHSKSNLKNVRQVSSYVIVLSAWFALFSVFDVENISTISCLLIFSGLISSRIDFQKIESIMNVMSILFLCIQGLQICLFFVFGRLPALGYQHSLSVRFGSLWDDPNGYGMFLVSMIYFHWMRKQLLLILMCLIALIATQSVTAMISLIATFVVYLFISRRTLMKWVILLAYVVALVFLARCIYLQYQSQIDAFALDYVQRKSLSASQHGQHFDMSIYDVWNFFGISPVMNFSESYLVNLLAFGGVWFVLALYVPMGLLAVAALQKMKDRRHLVFSVATLTSFMVGSIGLPLGKIFPYNIVISVVCAWMYSALYVQECVRSEL